MKRLAGIDRLLAMAGRRFRDRLCLATSFGPQTVLLIDRVAEVAPATTVFYLDTGLLFEETYALRDELAARTGLTFRRVAPKLSIDEQARTYGAELWKCAPDHCCRLRKVEPLRRFLGDYSAWITGIRRGQTALRAGTRRVEWDPAHGLVKINPLWNWSDEDVWSAIRARELPTNRLHRDGYPSIGCAPCTRRVLPGEDPRAGRWAGSEKTECGIHRRTGS